MDPKIFWQLAESYQRGVYGQVDEEVLSEEETQNFNEEEFDFYDEILNFLVNEGYCNTHKDAEVIMVNMSEEWRNSIISNLSSK